MTHIDIYFALQAKFALPRGRASGACYKIVNGLRQQGVNFGYPFLLRFLR